MSHMYWRHFREAKCRVDLRDDSLNWGWKSAIHLLSSAATFEHVIISASAMGIGKPYDRQIYESPPLKKQSYITNKRYFSSFKICFSIFALNLFSVAQTSNWSSSIRNENLFLSLCPGKSNHKTFKIITVSWRFQTGKKPLSVSQKRKA